MISPDKVCNCGCGMTYAEVIEDNVINAFSGSGFQVSRSQAEELINPEYFT